MILGKNIHVASATGQGRIDRVVAAWRTDPKFTDLNGRPKLLTVRGKRSEFAQLARKYGRDVTTKTLREDLSRNGLVSITDKGLELLDIAKRNAQLAAALADLDFLKTQLSIADFQRGKRTFATRVVSVPTPDPKKLGVMRRKATRTIETALSSMQSLISDERGRNRPGRSMHRLLVSVSILAETDSEPFNGAERKPRSQSSSKEKK